MGCLDGSDFCFRFLQGKLKNNITSGLITGLLFGLWVLPGYSFLRLAHPPRTYITLFSLWHLSCSKVISLMPPKVHYSSICLLFWLVATGSQINLYYFNPQVQIMQFVFFAICSCYPSCRSSNHKNVDLTLQTFPAYVLGSQISLSA